MGWLCTGIEAALMSSQGFLAIFYLFFFQWLAVNSSVSEWKERKINDLAARSKFRRFWFLLGCFFNTRAVWEFYRACASASLFYHFLAARIWSDDFLSSCYPFSISQKSTLTDSVGLPSLWTLAALTSTWLALRLCCWTESTVTDEMISCGQGGLLAPLWCAAPPSVLLSV